MAIIFNPKTGEFEEVSEKKLARVMRTFEIEDGKDGRDGANGKDGNDGIDGRDGKDGKKGDKGDKGDKGEAGQDGKDGIDGLDGVNGLNGLNGISLDYQWDGTKLGVKRENEGEFQFIDLKGRDGISGVSSGGRTRFKDIAEMFDPADVTVNNATKQISINTPDLSGYVPYTGATTNLDMGVFTVKTPSLLNYTDTVTVDVDNRSLNDDAGDPQIQWSSAGVIMPIGIFGVDNTYSIDPNNRLLKNTSYTTFDYGNALLNDVGGVASIALSNRYLTASNGSTQLLNYYNTTGAFLYGSSGTGFGDGTFTIRARIHANNSSATAVYARFTNASTGTTATDGLDVGIDNTGSAEIRNRENTAIKFYTANINYALLLANEPTLQLDSQGSNSVNAGKIIYRASGSAESFTTTFNASDNNFYFLYGATTVGSVSSTGWGFGVTTFDNSATVHIRALGEQLRIDNNGSSYTRIVQSSGNSLGLSPAVNSTGAFIFNQADGLTAAVRIDTTNKRLGVGTTPAATLHTLSTTEQFRASYSATNYWSATTDSAGTTTFNAAGSVPAFVFSDPVNITSSLQCDSIVNDTGLASGTYTPTLTGVTNVSSSTAREATYMRVGNTVTVAGQIDITPTANNTQTTIGISLPVASAFTTAYQCGGSGHTVPNTGAGHGCAIYADATNDRAEIDYYETHGATDTICYTFTYQVI